MHPMSEITPLQRHQPMAPLLVLLPAFGMIAVLPRQVSAVQTQLLSPDSIAAHPAIAVTALPFAQVTAESFFNQGLEKYQRKDYSGAIEAWNQAIRLDARYATAYYNRGVARHRLGESKVALFDLTEAIRLKPDYAEAYYVRGLIISEQFGDNQTAIKDFSQAIRIRPDYAAAYFKRGNARHRLGDNQGGIEDFNRAIQLNPADADAYFNRGVVRYKLGDRPGAVKDIQQASDLYRKQGDKTSYDRAVGALKQIQNER